MGNKTVFNFQEVLSGKSGLIDQAVEFLPSLMVAIAIIIAGYIVSKILKIASVRLLKRVGIDRVSQSIGLNEKMQAAGAKYVASNVIASLIFWVVFAIFSLMAADSLNLPQVSRTLDQFIIFIPKIIASLLIILLGFAVAHIAKSVVYKKSKSANVGYSKPASQIIFGIISILTISLAFGSLDIDTYLLDTLVSILVASVGLGAAISIGLGSRSASEGIMHSIYIRDVLKEGDIVTLSSGTRGTIVSIRNTVTLVQPEKQIETLVVDNKELLNGLKIHHSAP